MALLIDGQAMLAASLKQAAGRTVTYTRGAATYAFVAWPGVYKTDRPPTAAPGVTVERSEDDYLFLVADAKAAGLALPPQRGDRITDPLLLDDVTGQPKTVELTTPAGDRMWRYSDPVGQTTIRVHTKRAGA